MFYISVNSTWVYPPGQPPGIRSNNCPGVRDLTFESCPGAGNLTRAGILWKVQTPYKCVLRRRFVFRIFNNFCEAPCMKVALDVRISLVRVLCTGGRRGKASPPQTSLPSPPLPPKRKLFLKKI